MGRPLLFLALIPYWRDLTAGRILKFLGVLPIRAISGGYPLMTTMKAVKPARTSAAQSAVQSAVKSTVKTAKLALLVSACWLASCSSTPTPTPPAQKAVRAYNGTASVGDFLTISVDSIAQTITYKDYTNGETGTAPYPINADGSYTIIDPNANLLSAYEVPGTALMIEAANAGPLQNNRCVDYCHREHSRHHQHVCGTELQLPAVSHRRRRAGTGHGNDQRAGRHHA
jgi:hypothetical protein